MSGNYNAGKCRSHSGETPNDKESAGDCQTLASSIGGHFAEFCKGLPSKNEYETQNLRIQKVAPSAALHPLLQKIS